MFDIDKIRGNIELPLTNALAQILQGVKRLDIDIPNTDTSISVYTVGDMIRIDMKDKGDTSEPELPLPA